MGRGGRLDKNVGNGTEMKKGKMMEEGSGGKKKKIKKKVSKDENKER